MSIILGIDQSYTSCGLCLVNEDGVLIAFDRFKTNSENDTYARALEAAVHICDFITKHNPDRVQLEGLAFGIRGNATRDLAGLLFTIVNVIKLNHPAISCAIVAPTSVKKRATGSGKAKKKEMIAALPADVLQKFKEANYKLTTGLADLADAYWISQTK